MNKGHSAALNPKTIKHIVLWALFLTLLTASFAVLSQTVSGGVTYSQIQTAANTGGDVSRVMFERLLGPFGKDPFTTFSGAGSFLAGLFFVFNAVLFAIGTAFVGYHMVSAVANSAHEGEVLGKRMNSLWVPIRFSTGIFGMLPVFGGFSLSQAIMMMCALLGIGTANLISTQAITQNAKYQGVIAPPGIAPGVKSSSIDASIAHQIALMNLCVLSYNKYANLMVSEGQTQSGAAFISIRDDGLYTAGAPMDCGSIAFTDTSSTVDYRSNTGVLQSIGLGGFRNNAVDYESIKEMAKNTSKVRMTTLGNLQNEIAPIMTEWFSGGVEETFPPYPGEKLSAALKKVSVSEESAVKQAMSAAGVANSSVKGNIESSMMNGGWMTMGAWYSTFAEVNSALQTAATSSRLDVVPPDFGKTKLPDTVSKPLLSFAIKKEAEPQTCSALKIKYSANAIGNCSIGQSFSTFLIEIVVSNTGGEGMINPIIASKNIGDWMLTSIATLIVGKGVLMLAEKVPKLPLNPIGLINAVKNHLASNEGGVLSQIAGGASKIAPYILLAMVLLGIVYAVYIPFVPFLTWFSGLVSYIASVIEGLVAAQVWAFSHLHTDGEGMGQKTEKGYVYILNMLLRPGLMVLGFFMASGIVTLLGTFFFQQFATALANVQGDTVTGPLIFIGIVGVVMIALVSLIQTSFNLIYEVPDRVIAWFGHGMEARLAKEMDAKIEGESKGLAKWTSSSAGNIIGEAGKTK